MKNSKNKRAVILAIILVGLLIVGYKVVFIAPEDIGSIVNENISASGRVEALLQQVEQISFNTEVLNDSKFKSLKSIDLPLLSLPVGRTNPFAGISN